MPGPLTTFRTLALACAAVLSFLGADAAPQATPASNPAADALFARARLYWRERKDVPYLRYGALVRYLHSGHVFDNWWDAYLRTSDKAIGLTPLIDPVENNRRLGGVPFSIFGVKIFDTNPDAEPIRIDEPRIDPTSSFGIVTREGDVTMSAATPTPAPVVSGEPELREIGSVDASLHEYRIAIVGSDPLDGVAATHLTFVPLGDPQVYRIRDLWVDPATGRPIQMIVQGILNGQPYDSVKWTVRFTLVDGREYLQQLIADEPLRFGFETVVPKFEFDFVDYHFPDTIPQFIFDRPF
jgi:hypothetical protein